MPARVECELGGRVLMVETGKLAGLANGAVTVRYGDTVVLATACVSPQPREGVDFLPLTIDFEERLYAAGKIPGSFFRREGRPTQDAILTARLVDRPVRPLFPKGFCHEVQVIITVLSADQENEPDIPAIIGASTALTISEIPFEGPIGAAKIGYVDDKFVVNPTFSQLQESRLELVVVATKEAIVMLECGAKEIEDTLMTEAIMLAHEECRRVIALQEQLAEQVGKPKMTWTPASKMEKSDLDAAAAVLNDKLDAILSNSALAVEEREKQVQGLKQQLQASLADGLPASKLDTVFDEVVKQAVRRNTLEGRRFSGRGLKEIRPLSMEVGVLPRTHGSALFVRGQTQVLTITTLGTRSQEQHLDGLSPEESKRYIHHYNFPPYSTGEVRRIGSPGRREVGHGALAERALLPMIPSEEEFPYTIRLVSDVLSSNGSTSMASVCGSTLSLMDAGVPIKAPVAGIAMGLVTDEAGRHTVLTDIEGLEDHFGDMDFKVAGTQAGITALQLDIKIKGLSYQIIQETLAQAREARLFILQLIQEAIPAPRGQLSPHAPRIFRISIDPSKIGEVIGPGGRVIRSITERTGATIDIEDDGTVFVNAPTEDSAREALDIVEGLTKEVQVGEIYTGKVTRLVNFGAFVEILPRKEGLVPVSELAEYEVRFPSEVVKVGDEVMVKVLEIDRLGRINLSRRAVYETQPRQEARPQRPPGGAPSGAPPGRPYGTQPQRPVGRPGGPPRGPGGQGPYGRRPPGPR